MRRNQATIRKKSVPSKSTTNEVSIEVHINVKNVGRPFIRDLSIWSPH